MGTQSLAKLSDDQLKILVEAGIIPKDTPPAQVAVFAHVAKERGLSPFSKEIYLVKYGGIYSTIVGINGLRKIAAQSGEYAGCDDVKFDLQPNDQYLTSAQLLKANRQPATATVTVYRMIQGTRCPFTHTAVYREFAGSGPKWQTMPFQMIAKVAEAFAIRKAFSERTSGLDIEEERDAYENTQIVELSEIEKAKMKCRSRLEQCRMEDRREDKFSLRIENADSLDDLRQIYIDLREYLPEDEDPAKQYGQRENALNGTTKHTSRPTTNQI